MDEPLQEKSTGREQKFLPSATWDLRLLKQALFYIFKQWCIKSRHLLNLFSEQILVAKFRRLLSGFCNIGGPNLDRKDDCRLVLLFSLVRRIADNAKTNFSTEQSAAREDSWVSREDGNQKRPISPQTPSGEGPQTFDTGALLIRSLSSLQKLRNSSEYRQVYSSGRRYNGNLMTVFLCPNGLAHHRLGITASRKLSVRAVKRNRAKRLLRESFRLLASELSVFGKSYDWVFNAKRSLLEVKVADSLAEMKRILIRVAEDEN